MESLTNWASRIGAVPPLEAGESEEPAFQTEGFAYISDMEYWQFACHLRFGPGRAGPGRERVHVAAGIRVDKHWKNPKQKAHQY